MRLLDVALYIVQTVWFILEFIVFRTMKSPDEKTEKSFYKVMYIALSACVIIGIASGVYLKLCNSTWYTSSYFFPIAGIVLLVLGILIRYIAISTLKRYFTINLSVGEHHELITHGIYSLIRHPAYAGDIIAFLGLGIAYGNILSFILIGSPFLIFVSYRIPKEEKVMQERFGEEYSRWKRRTKRLIPYVY
jgi:protein-S-isoprenylcysteine O-methyltransferase Ste14